MARAEVVTHTRDDGSEWYEARWDGRNVEVFDASEASDAEAYAEAMSTNGGPLFDEEWDA